MFTVIIPVHNKLPHLDRSVFSVLNQTFKDYELLLIDDASTDGSEEKIKEYKDPRIRVFHRNTPGPGGYAARNLGIEKAKYEWIAFLDADDEWKDTYLDEVQKAIKKHNQSQIISSKWINDKKGDIYENSKLKFEFIYNNFKLIDFLQTPQLIWTGAVVIKKKLLDKVNGFPEKRCKRGGDYDTWIRCLTHSDNNIYINKTLSVYYRETINQATDRKKNPVKKICFISSLNKVREDTKDANLINAIDKFLAKKIYEHLKSFKLSSKENSDFIKQINSKQLRYKVKGKLVLRDVLTNLRILEKLK